MGVFFNALIVPRRGRAEVRSALEALDAEAVGADRLDLDQFRWLEQERGTLAVLEDCACYGQLPQALSRQLGGAAMLCFIYDDDFWGYELYDRGKWVDTFWTLPDCFQPIDPNLLRHSPEERSRLLAQYFCVEAADVQEYLVFWSAEDLEGDGQPAYPEDVCVRGDCWQLGDFLHRLGNWDQGALDPAPAPELRPASAPELSPNAPDPGNTTPRAAQPVPLRRPEPVWEALDLGKCLSALTGARWVQAPEKGPLSLTQDEKKPSVEALEGCEMDASVLERLLERFYAGELAQLELDFTLQGEGVFVKRLKKTVYSPSRLTVELVQADGRYLCVCFDDRDFYVYWLIADWDAYFQEDCKDHKMTTLAGRAVEEYLVHDSPETIRRELPLLLSHLHRKEEVLSCTSRMGIWSNEYHYRNAKKHQELRDIWCLSPR